MTKCGNYKKTSWNCDKKEKLWNRSENYFIKFWSKRWKREIMGLNKNLGCKRGKLWLNMESRIWSKNCEKIEWRKICESTSQCEDHEIKSQNYCIKFKIIQLKGKIGEWNWNFFSKRSKNYNQM